MVAGFSLEGIPNIFPADICPHTVTPMPVRVPHFQLPPQYIIYKIFKIRQSFIIITSICVVAGQAYHIPLNSIFKWCNLGIFHGLNSVLLSSCRPCNNSSLKIGQKYHRRSNFSYLDILSNLDVFSYNILFYCLLIILFKTARMLIFSEKQKNFFGQLSNQNASLIQPLTITHLCNYIN